MNSFMLILCIIMIIGILAIHFVATYNHFQDYIIRINDIIFVIDAGANLSLAFLLYNTSPVDASINMALLAFSAKFISSAWTYNGIKNNNKNKHIFFTIIT